MIRKIINYKDLPTDFWDNVVCYKYFISFSGFVEIEPHVVIWTNAGDEYYVSAREFRDGLFERAVTFFQPMVNEEALAKGYYGFRFDWEKVPDGWKYIYDGFHHCFLPDKVHERASKLIELNKKNDEERAKDKPESVEEMIVRRIMPRELIKKSYKEIMGIEIKDDVRNHIRYDEKIHVYDEPYVGKLLDINKITEGDISVLKESVAWYMKYTTPVEGLRNTINIGIYFETKPPFYMDYEFSDKGYSSYLDEHEFMGKLMEIIKSDLGNKKEGYSFDNAPEGYTTFKLYEDDWRTYWIRNDVYSQNYENVIKPFMNYSGNMKFLQRPIFGCVENKEVNTDLSSKC